MQLSNASTTHWHTAGGNNARCGSYPKAVRLSRRVARSIQMDGSVQAAPVFNKEGVAYIADMTGLVRAADLRGKTLWQAKLEGAVSSTPALTIDCGLLLAGTHLGWVYALDARDGHVRWRVSLPTQSDPRALSDALVIDSAQFAAFSSWGGKFHALDLATGKARFSWDAGISPSAGACADERYAYCMRVVAKRGIEVVRIDFEGKETVLHQEPEDDRGARRALVSANPMLDPSRNMLYAVVHRGTRAKLIAWDAKGERQAWVVDLPDAVQAAPALRADGAILVASLTGYLRTVTPDGQGVAGFGSGAEYLLSGPVAAGLDGYFGDPIGCLHRLNARGQMDVLVELSRSIQGRPAFSPQGDLYVPGTDHRVHIIEHRG